MIYLKIGHQKDQLHFDLTCDHLGPILYNTYGGSFTKDYVDKHANQRVISLFDAFDPELFRERVEGNGSAYRPLVNGIRVSVGQKNQLESKNLSIPFADAISASLQRYLTRATDRKPTGYLKTNIKEKAIPFNLINVAFSVKGSCNYLVCFSLNQSLSTYFLKKMVAEDGIHQDLYELIVDSIAEICNTIVGNAFTVFEECQGKMHLGTPIIFRFAQEEDLVSNCPIAVAEIQIDDMNVKAMVVYLDEVRHG